MDPYAVNVVVWVICNGRVILVGKQNKTYQNEMASGRMDST